MPRVSNVYRNVLIPTIQNRAKETIAQLKEEIGNLSKLVEKGAKMNSGQEAMVKELMKAREELQRQSEEQQSQVKVLEAQLHEIHAQREHLDAENQVRVRTTTSSHSPTGPVH